MVGLAAHRNVDRTARAVRRSPRRALRRDGRGRAPREMSKRPRRGARALPAAPKRRSSISVRASDADLVVNALVGFVGLAPTLAALEAGIPVAIANKESIVAGGELLLRAARTSGVELVPIDSEHVAIAQCLAGTSRARRRARDPHRVGRSLRDRSAASRWRDVSVRDVLAHPTWSMGAKITVDSATLVNKGLEIIEAHWLFGLPYDEDRRRDSSAVDRAFGRALRRRLHDRADGEARHAHPDSVRAGVSESVEVRSRRRPARVSGALVRARRRAALSVFPAGGGGGAKPAGPRRRY